MGAGEGNKSEILGGPAEGGSGARVPAVGGSGGGVSGGGKEKQFKKS